MGLRRLLLLLTFLSSLVQSQTIYDQLNEHTHQDCDVSSIQQEIRKGFTNLQQKWTIYSLHRQKLVQVGILFFLYQLLVSVM